MATPISRLRILDYQALMLIVCSPVLDEYP